MGKNKVQRTEDFKQGLETKVFLQEVDVLFGGCKIFIAVPAITGIDPAEMAKAFKEQMDYLRGKAKEPSPREMMDMSIAGISALDKAG